MTNLNLKDRDHRRPELDIPATLLNIPFVDFPHLTALHLATKIMSRYSIHTISFSFFLFCCNLT